MGSLRRGLEILELMAGADGPLTLGAIAERLALPKSATHRLMAELAAAGFVRQERLGDAYALTLKLASLGVQFLAALRIEEICQPVLDALAQKSGELVRLACAERDGLYWVARAQGATNGLRYDPEHGNKVHLHVTAVGKAWLATLPEQDALQIAQKQPGFGERGRFGPRALTSEAQLRAAIALARRRGYGQAVDEGEPGTSAIACAIRPDPAAPAVGTVSIAGPTARLTASRMQALLPPLFAAATELARRWPLRRYLAPAAVQPPTRRVA